MCIRDRIEKMASLRFPPNINDKIEKDCIKDFIEATSFESLQTVECGICGKAVKDKEYTRERIYNLPYDILGAHVDPNHLSEYEQQELLLSPGGVENDTFVNCCKQCDQALKNKKLPKFSIANKFQIGETPDELKGLTLPEKLLIALYRPKIHVVKLKSCSGPGTRQKV